jgi:2-oxoglutarate dehydrogenase E1 component
LERFLALCADDNITVSNPSTPAQYYYLLRMQAKYQNRRPLIVMTPKSLLRLPAARSKKDDFIGGKFQSVIDDEQFSDKKAVRRILITSGKFYYDLLKHKNENNFNDIAIVRIERYYPYPKEDIREALTAYENAEEVVWAQEEPENMGALNFMVLRLKRDLQHNQKLFSVSRAESASPAPGSYKIYTETQNKLIAEAFGDFK